jgi:DNA replication protein DnaC
MGTESEIKKQLFGAKKPIVEFKEITPKISNEINMQTSTPTTKDDAIGYEIQPLKIDFNGQVYKISERWSNLDRTKPIEPLPEEKKKEVVAYWQKVLTPQIAPEPPKLTFEEWQKVFIKRANIIVSEKKGKPREFVFLNNNYKIVFDLLVKYYTADETFNQSTEFQTLDLRKDIALIGSLGVFKTSLMQVFSRYASFGNDEAKHLPRLHNYKDIISASLLSDLYQQQGAEILIDYKTRKGNVIIDDLGTEKTDVANFGNKASVAMEIIKHRYENHLPVSFTSNLSVSLKNKDFKEFAEKYGDRFADRLREQFNILIISGESQR